MFNCNRMRTFERMSTLGVDMAPGAAGYYHRVKPGGSLLKPGGYPAHSAVIGSPGAIVCGRPR